MDILILCGVAIWLIGWVRMLATIHAIMQKVKIEYGHPAMRYSVPLVLFFTWPYFYFYYKA